MQEDGQDGADTAEERLAKAAEAATRDSAAAILKKQQHIPVKDGYFLPDDEQASGKPRQSYVGPSKHRV